MPDVANSSTPNVLTLLEPTGMHDVRSEVQFSMDSIAKIMERMYSITAGIDVSFNISGAMGSMTSRWGFVSLV